MLAFRHDENIQGIRNEYDTEDNIIQPTYFIGRNDTVNLTERQSEEDIKISSVYSNSPRRCSQRSLNASGDQTTYNNLGGITSPDSNPNPTPTLPPINTNLNRHALNNFINSPSANQSPFAANFQRLNNNGMSKINNI